MSYRLFLSEALSLGRRLWTQFDGYLMCWGLVLQAMSLLVMAAHLALRIAVTSVQDSAAITDTITDPGRQGLVTGGAMGAFGAALAFVGAPYLFGGSLALAVLALSGVASGAFCLRNLAPMVLPKVTEALNGINGTNGINGPALVGEGTGGDVVVATKATTTTTEAASEGRKASEGLQGPHVDDGAPESVDGADWGATVGKGTFVWLCWANPVVLSVLHSASRFSNSFIEVRSHIR